MYQIINGGCGDFDNSMGHMRKAWVLTIRVLQLKQGISFCYFEGQLGELERVQSIIIIDW